MRRAVTLVLMLAATACGRGDRAPASHAGHEHAEGAEISTDADAGASAGAGAASAAGMCIEHGVLEAVCTKCNPALAAVFQAKGDWCGEHGFPESFCPICHPERGGRPPDGAELSADEPPPDGLVIRLKGPDAEANAAFATARAEAAPSEDVVTAVARIEAGPRHRAEVSARAEAVVAKLLADAGDRVRAGQPLAALQGPAGETARARVSAAEARASASRAAVTRERSLLDRGISSAKDVLAAEREIAEAEAELDTARAQLSLVGGAGQRISSPLDGVVTKRIATIGQLVHAGDVLFEVADLSGVDAVADVREEILAGILPGGDAEVLVPAASAHAFPGEVESVAPTVDPLTRTGQVRVHVDNREGLLRPGMTAEARLRAAGRGDAVLVPRAAIQSARGASLAFVRTGPGVFEARRVALGALRGDLVEVTSGVRPGETVVTAGSYLLKTESLPGSIGSGCCEIDGQSE